jgi:hypothetical protein
MSVGFLSGVLRSSGQILSYTLYIFLEHKGTCLYEEFIKLGRTVPTMAVNDQQYTY